MPGENRAFVGYSSNCCHKEISLFKLPTAKDETTKKWRRTMLGVMTKDRMVDNKLQKADRERPCICL